MSWTAPMTFVDGRVLTAAQLNTHLRDNLMETEAAKITAEGNYLVAAAHNRLVERTPVTDRVDTTETTTQTGYTDLATIGPQVTVETGTKALLFISSSMMVGGADYRGAVVGCAINGETQREATDVPIQLNYDGILLDNQLRFGTSGVLNDLTPGDNTFTLKYSSGSGQLATFKWRFLAVLPL
jgi:hypothetical protein